MDNISIDKVLKNKLAKIAKKYNMLTFVLFGSYANNSTSKHSDLDLAFYTKKEMKYDKYMKLLDELYELIPINKIDLININTNDDPLLRYEIFKNGVCLYEKYENLFSELQNKAWFDYQDYKPFYDIQDEITKQNLAELTKHSQNI